MAASPISKVPSIRASPSPGAGTLELAQSDGGTISGLGVGGVLDLTNVSRSTASVQWVQGTGSGTLEIYNSGAMTKSLMLEGTYSQGDFFLFPDSGTGTEVAYGNDESTATPGNMDQLDLDKWGAVVLYRRGD